MALKPFDTAIEETSGALVGPWRRPHPMLNAQVYDSHASIHDDAIAQKLGFQGGTIEGPTHFSAGPKVLQRTLVFDRNEPSSPIATMLLNLATLKDSYAQEYRQLYS